MDDLIAELEKTGATELAGKLREAWKTHASESASTAKKLAVAEKALDKVKLELDAAGKGVDERVDLLTKERDAALANHESFKLRVKLADQLGITNKVQRERALDAFLQHHRPDNAGLDEKGELKGFEKAIEAFKKAEDFYFRPAEEPNGGGRAGSDPAPKVGGDPKDPTDTPDYWAKVYGYSKETK